MTLVIDKPADESVAETAVPLCVPRGAPRSLKFSQRIGLTLASVLSDLFGPREQRAFGILMYHRVANPPPGHPKPTWNVPPRRFEQQLAGLLARGWRAWSLSQTLECARRDLPIPRKTFVVTLDDGFANNLTQACPILTRLRIPATVFLATAYLDSDRPFPSDDWSAAGLPGVPTETWRPLTSEECARLTANGLVELGAHTHTHADFRGRPQAFMTDLQQNLQVLQERFGVQQPAFAFPYGTKTNGFASAELARAAREAGVVCSLTTEARIVRAGDCAFDWGRFAAEEHDTARTLAAKLSGWYEVVRGLKKFCRF